MARVTFSICDLCGDSFEEELTHMIRLSSGENDRQGDICVKCYEALSTRLEQETKPVLPRARKTTPTPSKQIQAPVPTLQAVGIVDTGEQTMGKSDGIVYKDEDIGLAVVESNFTDERRREVIRKMNQEGCRHENGFSMDESGPRCKDCGEKVRL